MHETLIYTRQDRSLSSEFSPRRIRLFKRRIRNPMRMINPLPLRNQHLHIRSRLCRPRPFHTHPQRLSISRLLNCRLPINSPPNSREETFILRNSFSCSTSISRARATWWTRAPPPDGSFSTRRDMVSMVSRLRAKVSRSRSSISVSCWLGAEFVREESSARAISVLLS